MAITASWQPKRSLRKLGGKITYPFSEKQKSDKTLVNCGLPFPSTAHNRGEKAIIICSLPARVQTEIKSPVFSEGPIWSELFPTTEIRVSHHKVLLLSSSLCAVSSS